MANLPEVAQWELGTYQIETTDPVLGGPDGPDNLAAKQLGNRTAWLKEQLPLLAPLLSASLTGSPTAPTAAEGTNTDQLATTAFVLAEIERVVAAAPAAVNTLAELATALNNDPDFAANIIAALALKAPLADPAFSGTPTAPTQAAGNSSTALATTAFVTAAVAAAIAVADATTTVKGIVRLATGAEAAAGTLDTVALTPSALNPLLNAKLAASLYTAADVLAKMKTVDGAGSGLDTDLVRGFPADFARSLATAGSATIAGGLKLKWGRINNIPNAANGVVTFPVAFPVACFQVMATRITGGNNSVSVPSWSAGGCTIYNRPNYSDFNATANDYFWLALGY